MCFGDFLRKRTLYDAYHKEHASHYPAFLDISALRACCCACFVSYSVDWFLSMVLFASNLFSYCHAFTVSCRTVYYSLRALPHKRWVCASFSYFVGIIEFRISLYAYFASQTSGVYSAIPSASNSYVLVTGVVTLDL